MIEKWYPNADRLEMFARTSGENWDVWGNQVDNSIELKSGEENFLKSFSNESSIEAQK
jgi:N6-adenosine-specific RNA methylase IME4